MPMERCVWSLVLVVMVAYEKAKHKEIHGFLRLFSDTIVSKVSGFRYCFLKSFVCPWKDVYGHRSSLSWWHMKRPNTRKSMDFFVSSPLVCFTWPSYVVCRYKKVLQPREIGFPRVYWPQNSYSNMYPGSNPCLSILLYKQTIVSIPIWFSFLITHGFLISHFLIKA